jgi:hypothetical protein
MSMWMWKRLIGLALSLSLVLFSGCGPAEVRAPDSDIGAAKTLLTHSLEQWKAGMKAEDLRSATPPIYFGDDALVKGTKLKDFKIVSEGEMYVSNVKFSVELQFEDGDGAGGRQRSVEYLVTTVPAQTIARLE